jgi:ketosteroid isomerase-like protein
MKTLDLSSRIIGSLSGLLVLFFLSFILINSATPQEKKGFDAASTRKVIDKYNAEFMAAMDKGDAEAAVSRYDKDALVMAPNQPTAEGVDAIKNVFAGFMKMGKLNLHLMTKSVVGAGNIAVASGTYKFEIKPEGKQAMKDHGKYLVVWQEQNDGSWKTIRDAWNSDVPLPSPKK